VRPCRDSFACVFELVMNRTRSVWTRKSYRCTDIIITVSSGFVRHDLHNIRRATASVHRRINTFLVISRNILWCVRAWFERVIRPRNAINAETVFRSERALQNVVDVRLTRSTAALWWERTRAHGMKMIENNNDHRRAQTSVSESGGEHNMFI
jgi:hypothetical protein